MQQTMQCQALMVAVLVEFAGLGYQGKLLGQVTLPLLSIGIQTHVIKQKQEMQQRNLSAQCAHDGIRVNIVKSGDEIELNSAFCTRRFDSINALESFGIQRL